VARVTSQLLWTPSAALVDRAAVTAFRTQVEGSLGVALPDTRALHAWSVAHSADFWTQAWVRLGLRGHRGTGPAIVHADDLERAAFFPDAALNVTDTLLARHGSAPALIAWRETGERRELSWDDLRGQARSFAGTLRDLGVGPGDRVAAWMPHVPETVVAFLGAAMIGAVFSSASPDFGVAGVLDRFGQIKPKVLVAADGYVYGGVVHHRLDRLAQVVRGLPSRPVTFVVPVLAAVPDLTAIPGARSWDEAVTARPINQPAALPFDHPLLVLYSSGTTGAPKAIVHRAGGVLLKHLVEHQLHCDVRAGDRVFHYTTCGWMMWNWLVSALGSGATIVLYDGSPVHPTPHTLLHLVERERITLFGTSARFLDGVRAAGLAPGRHHDLSSLRTITSTGSVLSAEGFRYVYDSVAADVHLASITGGTDIVGCFAAGDPTRPVYAGEIQAPALGLDVDVLDEAGASLESSPGTPGELVCRNAFPSLPLGFWGDDGTRYHRTYFDHFPGVWTHGDYASRTSRGGFVVHGRSDATLNVGGVRIGTAEIYRVVETLPQVQEALAVAQEWKGDTRIVLFVVPAAGVVIDDDIRDLIRSNLRDSCSPRHVPARIVDVPDLPRTRSGKLAELAVRDAIHGRLPSNREALANPAALEHVQGRRELTD
jgi:acetoacetyl-CoA synthetase